MFNVSITDDEPMPGQVWLWAGLDDEIILLTQRTRRHCYGILLFTSANKQNSVGTNIYADSINQMMTLGSRWQRLT